MENGHRCGFIPQWCPESGRMLQIPGLCCRVPLLRQGTRYLRLALLGYGSSVLVRGLGAVGLALLSYNRVLVLGLGAGGLGYNGSTEPFVGLVQGGCTGAPVRGRYAPPPVLPLSLSGSFGPPYCSVSLPLRCIRLQQREAIRSRRQVRVKRGLEIIHLLYKVRPLCSCRLVKDSFL